MYVDPGADMPEREIFCQFFALIRISEVDFAGYFFYTIIKRLSIDIVRMSRPVTGDAPACLSPAGGVGRTGVDNAADLRKSLVELYMGGSVRRRIVLTLHFPALLFCSYQNFRS